MSAPVSVPWSSPFRVSGGVTVLRVELGPDGNREADAVAILDAEERERWRRYPYAGPRRQFALCRAALRAALCEELACGNEQLAFPTTEEGKPWATLDEAPAPISFSVSHSGRFGLIALAPGGRLGVDVEELAPRRNLELLMDGVLGEAEKAEVASQQGAAQIRSFFRLWTMKEALLKAHGKGLLIDATTFEIPPAVREGAGSGLVQLPQLPGVTFQVEDLGTEGFAAALARDVPGARR